MTGIRSTHSAAPSLLGYSYQCRYALLEALRRLPSENRFSISIEKLDDIEIEQEGRPIDVLQTKHHTPSPRNLSDYSPDLWKTLGIWIDGLCKGRIAPDAQFFLITTAQCATGTAAAYLRPGDRDPAKALKHLSTAATTSTNQVNRPAYESFKSVSDRMREQLVNSITVFDGSPSIGRLDEDLKKAVYYAVERRHLDSYISHIEGWWYRRVLKHLQDDSATSIRGDEIEVECNRIRDQFKQDNLPVDDDIMSKTVGTDQYDKMTFVEQLNLINVKGQRRHYAVTNYFRAFTQRSQWLRELLVNTGELDRYDTRLNDEWHIRFVRMKEKLDNNASDPALIKAARCLYEWVETGEHHPIRIAFTEPSIARGTYQMMADVLRVGWHPEFRTLLQDVPSDVEVSQ